MRRRAAIVFIPEVFYYLSNIVRMLPAKVLFKKLFLFLKLNSLVQVQLLITDFFDTGIDDGYDNSDS